MNKGADSSAPLFICSRINHIFTSTVKGPAFCKKELTGRGMLFGAALHVSNCTKRPFYAPLPT